MALWLYANWKTNQEQGITATYEVKNEVTYYEKSIGVGCPTGQILVF